MPKNNPKPRETWRAIAHRRPLPRRFVLVSRRTTEHIIVQDDGTPDPCVFPLAQFLRDFEYVSGASNG